MTNAATTFAHRFSASVSLYGTGIVTDKEDSPHLKLGKIGGEIYYAFAETDQSTPPEYIKAIRDKLDAGGATYEIEILPGTQHGFGFPERIEYHAAASDAAWKKAFALRARTLKA